MTLETMRAVVDELERRGVKCAVEYPGWINIPIPLVNGYTLACSDQGDTIDIDLMDSEGSVLDTVESTLPRDSADILRIADHIACTYTEAIELQGGTIA